jgi:hypothetical protein
MGSAFPSTALPASVLSAGSLESLRWTLRALWNRDIALYADAEWPHLSRGAIHLPALAPAGHDDAAWRRAAVAHAAAHLVYSPPVFDGRGLKPLVRALVGVLEDARVEHLAVRELPGLRHWWRPRHTVTPWDGDGVDVLLLRLARALADPDYEDPHPWVCKGRALFFLDVAGHVLAEPRADQLRVLASRLGHDLGQMRLQFNAKGHRPGPDYRDDHRWMWPDAGGADETPPPPPPSGQSAPEPVPDETTPHPEWDRLIARLRPAWCRVVERAPVEDTPEPIDRLPIAAPPVPRRLLLGRQATGRWRTRDDGPRPDLDALVRARIARRAGQAAEGRWSRARGRERRVGHLLLLVDQSASTAGNWHGASGTQLQAATALAWQTARTAQAAGLSVALAGFSSNGRHAVRWQQVLDFGEPLDRRALARLAALSSAGSTRLGAALRHAVRRLAPHRDGERLVLVFSDAETHDIDVHDPRYLAEDARQAVRHARRQGVQVSCLVTDLAHGAQARHIFGARQVAGPRHAGELPRALMRLLG